MFFQGDYGLDFKVFWIVVHSIHDVVFVLAIFFNWKLTRRRIPLLFLFGIHVCVRVWTLAYFAPAIIGFQQISFSDTVDAALVHKAAVWRNLNYVRVGLFTLVNISLVPLFKLTADKIDS